MEPTFYRVLTKNIFILKFSLSLSLANNMRIIFVFLFLCLIAMTVSLPQFEGSGSEDDVPCQDCEVGIDTESSSAVLTTSLLAFIYNIY